MFEPNAHPVIVHFVVAFLLTAPILYLVTALLPAGAKMKPALQPAADWMFALGVVFAAAAVAAGFQAYYSVMHDAPSHAAMTDHRNFALATAAVFVGFGVWRLVRRKRAPSLLFALLLLAPAALLATTAWKGGRLVYHHGLGVASMPDVMGEGHDHEHAPGEGHDADASSADDAGAAGENDGASLEDLSTPAGVVEAFGAALKSGDAAAVERLLAPEVLIAESGGAERSFAEYQSHHMPADMEFMKATQTAIEDRRIFDGGDMAVVVTAAAMHGEFRGEVIHSRMMETMALARIDGDWRIQHIHWSSAPITGEHEH